MSINDENDKPGTLDYARNTIELLKPEDKADAVFDPTDPAGERVTPEPNRNVHPLFGRILRQWERIQPVEGPDPRD